MSAGAQRRARAPTGAWWWKVRSWLDLVGQVVGGGELGVRVRVLEAVRVVDRLATGAHVEVWAGAEALAGAGIARPAADHLGVGDLATDGPHVAHVLGEVGVKTDNRLPREVLLDVSCHFQVDPLPEFLGSLQAHQHGVALGRTR